MRFGRQLPPARTTLRVTLEVMLVLSRKVSHKSPSVTRSIVRPFCRATTRPPLRNKARIEGVSVGAGGKEEVLVWYLDLVWMPARTGALSHKQTDFAFK